MVGRSRKKGGNSGGGRKGSGAPTNSQRLGNAPIPQGQQTILTLWSQPAAALSDESIDDTRSVPGILSAVNRHEHIVDDQY